jgi:alpha-tubulin suppressor-like RCC1 family protein
VLDGSGVKTVYAVNTEIKAADGSEVKESDLIVKKLTIADIDAPNEDKISNVVKVGVDGKHVEFSKPVKLSILTSNLNEGDAVEVKVQHEGKTDWTIDSLTSDGNATCTNGVASSITSGSQVKDGFVSIYTCGASNFILSSTTQPRIFDNPNPTIFSTGSVNTDVNKTVTIYNSSAQESKITAGQYHTCAITAGEALKCWGWNGYNQLGDGTAINKSVPTTAVGITEPVYTVEAGPYNSCAITFSGKVFCTGYGLEGQSGDGTNTSKTQFTQVPGITDATSIGIGERTICVTLNAGGVKCWGSNIYGQLGDGTNINKNVPTLVSGSTGNKFLKVVQGQGTGCALSLDGAVFCFGYNAEGELGNGTNTNSNIPVPVSVLDRGVKNIYSAEGLHFCAVLADDTAKCWGYGATGNLGNGANLN